MAEPTTNFKLMNKPSDLATLKLLSSEEIAAIREDMRKTFLPGHKLVSWRTEHKRIPRTNAGMASHEDDRFSGELAISVYGLQKASVVVADDEDVRDVPSIAATRFPDGPDSA